MDIKKLNEIGYMQVGHRALKPTAFVNAYKPVVSSQPGDHTPRLDGIMWRQSMIHDILRCPRMAAQEWVYNTSNISLSPIENDTKRGFIAAVFGTAAHAVIERYNNALMMSGGIAMPYTKLLSVFEEEAEKEYDITSELIPIPRKCETFRDAMESVGAEYLQYILGHIAYEKTRSPQLTVTASEQKFVMFVIYQGDLYLFTGMIDQLAVEKESARLFMRDFKFRDAAFKPTWRQLQVDPQMIIYCCALKYGVPSCPVCEPNYTVDPSLPYTPSATNPLTQLNNTATFNRKIRYDGPCDKCQDKMHTSRWPKRFPDAGELIWMKDYRILKRGTAHRKKGEIAGEGVYNFKFNSDNASAYMDDVMQHCMAFRYGFHPRKYGEACKFWCQHAKDCVDQLVYE